MSIRIQTPRGTVFTRQTKGGKVVARLEWNPGFGAKKTGHYMAAQRYIDSEVLRFCSARVPFYTGMLEKSGILGTVVGSGLVWYIANYAAKQNDTLPTRSYDANRGGLFFERGKAQEKDRILRNANRIAGGGR